MKTDDKVAFITGVTGQDGSLLARLLLSKGYEVHGLKRRSSSFNTGRIDDLHLDPQDEDKRFKLHFGDITDSTNILRLIDLIQPDEIYGLAATPARFAERSLMPRTPVLGLFLTGTDAATLGVVGALFGGLFAASVILGRDLRGAVAKGAEAARSTTSTRSRS